MWRSVSATSLSSRRAGVPDGASAEATIWCRSSSVTSFFVPATSWNRSHAASSVTWVVFSPSLASRWRNAPRLDRDVVARPILQDAVLLHRCCVSEGVGADHRLVGLDGGASQLGNQARGAGDLGRVDAGLEAETRLADAQQHHDLFERGVAGALPDAVDRALNPPGAGHDPGLGVGGRKAQVVVAVNRKDDAVCPASPADHLLDDLAELGRNAVAGRVGDVDDVGPEGDHRLDRLDQVVGVGAARVLGRVLDVVAKGARVRDGLGALPQDLLARQPELALDVQVGDRYDDVDLRGLGVLDRTPDGVDLVSIGPRQRGHSDAADLARDAPAGVELAGRGARETGFDDVHAQLFELPGDAQLGGGVQVEA